MPTWLIEEPETLIVPGLAILATIIVVSTVLTKSPWPPRFAFALLFATMIYNALPQNHPAPSRLGDLYLPTSEMELVGVSPISPDGQWKAARFYRAGGGGFAPFCYEAVNVVSASDAKPTYNRSDLVYAANCEDLELEWLSDKQLQITFARRHDLPMKVNPFVSPGKTKSTCCSRVNSSLINRCPTRKEQVSSSDKANRRVRVIEACDVLDFAGA